jgi:hypothetical protein
MWAYQDVVFDEMPARREQQRVSLAMHSAMIP